jgi:predicted DNA-binding transcriptional regulator YafY
MKLCARSVSSSNQALVPPSVSETVLDVVASALLEERRFRCSYRRRGSTQDKDYEIHTLGLVLRDGAMMLVCTLGDPADIRQLLLHRMRRAELCAERAVTPRDFDLDLYLAAGVGYRRGAPFKLVARMHADAAITLHEAPLSRDQRLAREADGWERVEATVADTLELRGWLLSYAELIEVLEPATLRAEIARRLRAAARVYGEGDR